MKHCTAQNCCPVASSGHPEIFERSSWLDKLRGAIVRFANASTIVYCSTRAKAPALRFYHFMSDGVFDIGWMIAILHHRVEQ
jgi:hypothetical protein